jgi:uncharacterized membrane protein YbaN (DUF454 family)
MNEPTLKTGPLRLILLAAGWIFVAIGAIGAVLPVLPTTPFLILAAACFVRSSPRFYRWLLRNRLFGPLIESWRATRTIPGRTKIVAIALIVLVGGSSVMFFVGDPRGKLLLAVTLLIVILWILRVPSTARRRAGPRAAWDPEF